MERVLVAEGLTKRFGDHTAVDAIDLHVDAGESVGFVGPNGAGKTTTLLMLLGVVLPDAGSITVMGHRLPDGRAAAMADVGFAAGYLPLPDRLRVDEFLRTFAALYGLPDARAVITSRLRAFGIEQLAERRGVELSSGQRTLVGIVKATLHDPQLLVLDEPTASLDPDVARRVRAGLEQLRDDHDVALLVTSHNMVEVERLCQRVVFLSDGRVIADGSPKEVTERFNQVDLEGVFLDLAEGGETRERP